MSKKLLSHVGNEGRSTLDLKEGVMCLQQFLNSCYEIQ